MGRYAEYKDSGLEWIGEIPAHWDFLRMKNVFTFSKGLNITKADLVDEGMPVISYGQIHSKNNTGVHISNDLIRYVDESYLELGKSALVFEGDIYLQIHPRIIAVLGTVYLSIIKEIYLQDTIL